MNRESSILRRSPQLCAAAIACLWLIAAPALAVDPATVTQSGDSEVTIR